MVGDYGVFVVRKVDRLKPFKCSNNRPPESRSDVLEERSRRIQNSTVPSTAETLVHWVLVLSQLQKILDRSLQCGGLKVL